MGGSPPFTPIREWIPEVPQENIRKVNPAYVDQLATNAALRLLAGVPESVDRFNKIFSYDWSVDEVNQEIWGANVSNYTLMTQGPLIQERLDEFYSRCGLRLVNKVTDGASLLLVSPAVGNGDQITDGCQDGVPPLIRGFRIDAVKGKGQAVATLNITNPDGDPLFAVIDWGDGDKPELFSLTKSDGDVRLPHQYGDIKGRANATAWVMDYSGLVDEASVEYAAR